MSHHHRELRIKLENGRSKAQRPDLVTQTWCGTKPVMLIKY